MLRIDLPLCWSIVLVAGLLALAIGAQRADAQVQACAPFSDVAASHPFCADMQWIYNRGVTRGCGAPSGQTWFCPSQFVTREQMAAFMGRLGRDLDDTMCRGTDPSCYNDWGANRQNRVLIFSRTAGPRHASIGNRLAAGLNPTRDSTHTAQNEIIALLATDGITVDWTEDVTQIASLERFRAVIFLNTSRDVLWAHGRAIDPNNAVNTSTSAGLDAAKVNLRQYMRAGGGFVGIHSAFGTEYNWPYYEGLLGGTNYYNHAANQDGVIRIESADASTNGIGPPGTQFAFRDEFFNLTPFPKGVKFLASVVPSSITSQTTTHPGHPDFHPVAWCHYYDGGRAFVTTLGHDRLAYSPTSGFAGAAQFRSLLLNGIKSAMGLLPFCT